MDQDDYLMREDAVDIILRYCLEHNTDVFKIFYSLPDNLSEGNREGILKTATMPWQYIVRTDIIDDCYFKEDIEYGSDIPYTIKMLVKNKYMTVLDNLNVKFIKLPTYCNQSLYFYNYLNQNSYMNYHTASGQSNKNKQINEAFIELQKIKDEYDYTATIS